MKFKGSGKTGSRGGKDFYIVLLLCAAVLGTSGWIALQGAGTDVETQESADAYVRQYSSEDEPAEETAEAAVPVMAEAETTETASEELTYIRPVYGGVQRPYSVQTLLYDATMRDWRTHDGVDYACAQGTAVVAAADGSVVSVTEDALYGTTVTLSHADGMVTVYANLSSPVHVLAGEAVTQGQILGAVGSSALAESGEVSHLHFAMQLDGRSVDPGDYIE